MHKFADFHTVQDLKFDVLKLQEALKQVLKIKKYDNANGIQNFAAICLNQIPGKPESTKGNNARGVYWTKPDSSGNEVQRDKMIDESKYTEFVNDFKDTYFKEVYDALSKKYTVSWQYDIFNTSYNSWNIGRNFEMSVFDTVMTPLQFSSSRGSSR